MPMQGAAAHRSSEEPESTGPRKEVDSRKLLPLLLIVVPVIWAIMATVAYIGVRLVR